MRNRKVVGNIWSINEDAKQAMPLLFTMAGIMVVAGIGSFLIFTYEGSTSDQSPTPTNNTGLVSQSPSATPLEVSEEEQVFRTIRSFSDASNAKKRLPNGKIQIQITEVWITKSEKTVDGVSLSPEYSMNVLLETENLDNVNAVTVHRESAVIGYGFDEPISAIGSKWKTWCRHVKNSGSSHCLFQRVEGLLKL